MTVMEERLGSGWSDNSDMMVDGKLPDVANGASRTVRSNVAGPDFFTTLGVPVLSGRDFADSDTAASPHVGIINEEFARRFLPNQNPLGHTIGTDDGQYTMTIVGVVKDHKYRSIDEEPIPMAWYMYAQIPMVGPMSVEMRVHGEPLAILPAARKAVQQIDPNLPLIQPMTQRAQFDTTISQQILFARLAGFFGFLAVVLVATGLYGTLAYRVSMRTAEIGVRMAVGARREQVVWMILKDSLALTCAGVRRSAFHWRCWWAVRWPLRCTASSPWMRPLICLRWREWRWSRLLRVPFPQAVPPASTRFAPYAWSRSGSAIFRTILPLLCGAPPSISCAVRA